LGVWRPARTRRDYRNARQTCTYDCVNAGLQ
jgi:hypothetical protein